MAQDLQFNLSTRIKVAIEEHVKDVREQVITEAVNEFEKRVRQVVGTAAINMANYYSVERMGTDLLIRVKIEGQ